MPSCSSSHWVRPLPGGMAFLISCGVGTCTGSPTSPAEIAQLSLGAAYDVYVEGATAYVSNNQGIAILDIGDIGSPRRIASISEGSSSGIVRFHELGDTLLTYGDRLSLYDITQRDAPVLLSSFVGRDYLGGAVKEGDRMYLAYLNGGFEVVDYHDPQDPTSLSFIPTPGRVDALALRGGFVYLAVPNTGLEIIDIRDPSAPIRWGVVPNTVGATDIHMQGNHLYLACFNRGVKILDSSDPSAPQVLGSFSNGGETWGVFALGSRLYTADLQQGVEVLDIRDPTRPILVMADGHYRPHDLFADDHYLYLADQDKHFVILPLELEGVS